MMRFPTALLLAALAACASGTSTGAPPASDRSTVVVTSAGSAPGDNAAGTVTTTRDTRGTVTELAAPPDRVWAALAKAYQQLEIPVGTIESQSRTYGNRQFTASRRLAGEPLSAFLRCGTGSFGTPSANTHRVTISVLTFLSPAAKGGTQVETRVDATAENPGTSTAPVQCTSTGKLEQRIASALEQQIGS